MGNNNLEILIYIGIAWTLFLTQLNYIQESKKEILEKFEEYNMNYSSWILNLNK